MEINWLDTLLKFLGGLGLFFFGMKQLSDSLQSMSGDLIKKILSSLTANRVLGVMVGCGLTMLVQSSSVITVMAVGFVNAGLMTLTQAISIIFGSNIGTTVTGWIITLKVSKWGIQMIGIGAIPALFVKNKKVRAIGGTIFSLGLIFYGLQLMSGAFKPLRTDPTFQSYLTYFTADTLPSLLATVLVGCILTMIIQSSSAMLGITIALATAGTIEFQTAAALVMGENIGTTITALLASIGTTTNAKRTAYAHMTFNCTAVLLLACIFWPYVDFIDWLVPGDPNALVDGAKPNIGQHIAMSHTIFNVTATIVFTPFLGVIASIVTWMAPEQPVDEVEKLEMLGEPRTVAPAIAIEQAYGATLKMATLVEKQLKINHEYVLDPSLHELHDKVEKYEGITDNMQREIQEYLCTVMEVPMTNEQTHRINALISIADDLESISDYIALLGRFRSRLAENKHDLTESTKEELGAYLKMIEETFEIMFSELKDPKTVNMSRFDTMIDRLKQMNRETREKHLERIKEKEYKPLSGLTYADMVNALRKIMGHMAGVNKAVDGMNKVKNS